MAAGPPASRFSGRDDGVSIGLQVYLGGDAAGAEFLMRMARPACYRRARKLGSER